MTGWSIPPLLMASINAYVAAHYATVYTRTRKPRELMSFPYLALALCIYDVASAFLYNASAPAAGRPWQIVQYAALGIGVVALLVFTAQFTGRRVGRFVAAMCAGYALLLAAVILGGSRLLVTDVPLVRSVALPFGFGVTYNEMAPGPLGTAYDVMSLAVFGYIYVAGVGLFRSGERLRARRLLVATGILCLAGLNDAALGLGLTRSIYMIEYAFMGMVILMADSLSMDLVRIARMDDTVRQIQRNYREVFDSAGDAIFVHDAASGAILDVNQTMVDLFGYTRDEALELTVADLSAPHLQYSQRAIESLIHRATEEGPQLFEWRSRRKNGEEFPTEMTLKSAVIDGRKRVLAVVRDITERDAARATLHESEEEFRTLAETTTTGILIHAGEEFLYANTGAARITGYEPRELLAMKFWEVLHPDVRDEVKARGLKRLAGDPGLPARYETRLLTSDGRVRWVDLTSGAIVRKGQRALVVTINDVTEERRLKELRAAIYEISEATHTTGSLEDLFRSIHAIIGRLMNATNLYIALHDPATNLISFPYFVDEVDTTPEPFPLGSGMTSYVIRAGRPLLATPGVLAELESRGEIERLGAASIDWLGVPLKVQERVIGVLAVQCYVGDVRYTDVDEQVLSYVSTQVAAAIERKRSRDAVAAANERLVREADERVQAEQALRASEGKLRAIFAAISDVISKWSSSP